MFTVCLTYLHVENVYTCIILRAQTVRSSLNSPTPYFISDVCLFVCSFVCLFVVFSFFSSFPKLRAQNLAEYNFSPREFCAHEPPLEHTVTLVVRNTKGSDDSARGGFPTSLSSFHRSVVYAVQRLYLAASIFTTRRCSSRALIARTLAAREPRRASAVVKALFHSHLRGPRHRANGRVSWLELRSNRVLAPDWIKINALNAETSLLSQKKK